MHHLKLHLLLLLHLCKGFLIACRNSFGALRTHTPTLKHWLVQLNVVLNLFCFETAIFLIDLVGVLINSLLVLCGQFGGWFGHLMDVLWLYVLILASNSIVRVLYYVVVIVVADYITLVVRIYLVVF